MQIVWHAWCTPPLFLVPHVMGGGEKENVLRPRTRNALASVPRRFRFRGVYMGVAERREKRLGALVLRLTSEVGVYNSCHLAHKVIDLVSM